MGVRVRVKVHVQARWLLGKQAETPFRPVQAKRKTNNQGAKKRARGEMQRYTEAEAGRERDR
jgi:hypothetical protein